MYINFNDLIVPPVIYSDLIRINENKLIIRNGFVLKGENKLIKEYLKDKKFDLRKIEEKDFECFSELDTHFSIPVYRNVEIAGALVKIPNEKILKKINQLYTEFFHYVIEGNCKIYALMKDCSYYHVIYTEEDVVDEFDPEFFYESVKSTIYIIRCFTENKCARVRKKKESFKENLMKILI